MRTIDVHAHLVPPSLWRAAEAGRDWYGFRHEPGDGVGTVVGGGKRTHFTSPKVRFTPEERLKDMDAQGVDVQAAIRAGPRRGRRPRRPRPRSPG